MKRSMTRSIFIAMLAIVVMFMGAVPAFADGKGNGKGPHHGKNNGKGNGFQLEVRGKGHGQGKEKVSFQFEYDDVDKEAEWAKKYIASLAAKKVFEGYTDGTFRPNKPVTRIEAVVAAVRLMGLREEAEDPNNWDEEIQFSDEKQIRKKYSWATGYVVVAQEEGLFDDLDGKLQPEKSADRLWVTKLMVKALDLEDEAVANRNAKLTFTDREAIPQDMVGYVKVAVDKGIITGYANGTFRPNKPVTRAELATMLDRTDSQLPDRGNDLAASGTIVSLSNQTMVLRNGDSVQAYALDPLAFVFREGKKVTVSELKSGDTVFIRTYNNLVIFVEVLEPAKEDKPLSVSGVFESYRFNENGKISHITISDSITGNGKSTTYTVDDNVVIDGNANELREGRFVELEGKNNVVTKIKIGVHTFQVEGKLESITLNSNGQIATISLRRLVNGNEQITIYTVSSDVRINGNLSLLDEGQLVVLSGTHQLVTEIQIKN